MIMKSVEYPVVILTTTDSKIVKTLVLEHPVNIGRRVKVGPDEQNGIFDNKVLSRNHAEIYAKNNTIYIKDSKSSNGTFVNNKRLSPEGEPSEPCVLKNGDLLEFGIDITDQDSQTILYHKVSCRVTLQLPLGIDSNVDSSVAELLDKEIAKSEGINAELEQLKDSVKKFKENAGTVNKLNNQLSEAQREISHWKQKYDLVYPFIEKYEAQVSNVQQLQSELDTLKQTKEKLFNENAELNQQLAKKDTELLSRSTSERDMSEKLKSLNEEITATTELHDTKVKHLEEELESSQTELQASRLELQDSNIQISSMKSQIEKIKSLENSIKESNEKTTKQTLEYSEKVNSISLQLDESKSNCENLETRVSQLTTENTNLKAECLKVKSIITSQLESSSSRDEYEGMLNTLESENKALKEKLKETDSQRDKLESQIEEKDLVMEREIEKWRQFGIESTKKSDNLTTNTTTTGGGGGGGFVSSVSGTVVGHKQSPISSSIKTLLIFTSLGCAFISSWWVYRITFNNNN